MHARAASLIQFLRLQPHPEGGYFREVFRSPATVQPHDDRDARPAITTIYFLLAAGQHSRWHRVASDEIWHYYEGDPLELFWIDEQGSTLHHHLLGTVDDTTQPVHVVPVGCWQAARPTGAYTLVGCSVGPGFDFTDFCMLGDLPEEAARLRARFPELHALL